MALFDLVDVRRLYVTAEILRETLVANTSDEFGILQKKKSEFWLETQLQLTAEFLSNFDFF